MGWHDLANPTRFLRFSSPLLAVAGGLAAGVAPIALWLALVAAPPDYQQGETVRILYVHVPAAWLALGIYALLALAATSHLVWRHVLAALLCRAAAPVGALFTLICLATGSLWGQPMWGTWWVWDARLTSVLLLLFLYLGYMALARAFDQPERGDQMGSILLLLGAVNVPIIRFSVDWWATLHQPASILREGGPALHPSLLLPLLLMAGTFALLALIAIIWRLRAELAERQLRTRSARP